MIVTFFEGLRESQHPYKVIVEVGLLDMLHSPNAVAKVVPLLPNIAGPLRNALSQQNKVYVVNQELILTSLRIFKEVIRLVGHEIEPFLGALLPPIASRVLNHDHVIRDEVMKNNKVQDALTELQLHGGPKCLEIIRKRIPTYNPQMF
jgi:hypothetical protein